jgi:guanine nucleotide-binding protein subunit alpha
MALGVKFHHDTTDPLAVITAPSPNESPHEKAAREEREAEARRISDLIDEELRAERAVRKKEDGMVKILLLGQGESGVSN